MFQPKAESSLVPILPATSDPAATVTPGANAPSSPVARPRVRLHAGSSAHLTSEVQTLLRSRLRLAASIAAVASLLFFIWSFFGQAGDLLALGFRPYLFHGLMVLVDAGIAGILFTRREFSLRVLRIMELGFFGLAALFFAYVQFNQMCDGGATTFAAEGHRETVVRLANLGNILRWFALVVLYGTFIPNTWRRCAIMVGSLALMPIGLILWFALVCPVIGHLLTPYALVDTILFMSLGSAIAIFGSYKLSALHQEAFEMRQLGQYRLKEKLGFGGMGEVYLAEHRLLRRPCAIKLIRPDRAGDANHLRRFEREVQATARLTHWNTVEIYDYNFTDDGTFYYVMEYLPGEDLQELVYRHGPLPPERVIHVIRQVCASLHEAHGVGLIHRDIKPNNIILCERGGVHDVVKLVDFGLVQVSELQEKEQKLTRQGSIAGSPPYMAPEQAKGLDQVDPRSDIYSIGAVAYYLLTGKPPFERETPIEIIAAHLRDPVIAPRNLRPDLPPDLQEVVMKCLEKNPLRRFQTVDELGTALAGCRDAARWTAEHADSWWKNHKSHRGIITNGDLPTRP